MDTTKTSPFTQLVTYLTQGNVKQKKRGGFKKTMQLREQRSLMLQLMQKVFYAQNKYTKYQQQFNHIAHELLPLIQQNQNANTSVQLVDLIKKYQLLIELILSSIMDGAGDGTTPKLQMPIFTDKKNKIVYEDVIKKINHLFKKTPEQPKIAYESIGDVVVNIILGIFSFFITDLELDEEDKNELNKELTTYKKQQQNINLIFTQTVSILKNQLDNLQLKSAKPQPIQQNANNLLPNPYSFNLICRPGGGSETKTEK
jgi:uncharacterized membrane-anchored protein YhcB (DUF1043 family)